MCVGFINFSAEAGKVFCVIICAIRTGLSGPILHSCGIAFFINDPVDENNGMTRAAGAPDLDKITFLNILHVGDLGTQAVCLKCLAGSITFGFLYEPEGYETIKICDAHIIDVFGISFILIELHDTAKYTSKVKPQQ